VRSLDSVGQNRGVQEPIFFYICRILQALFPFFPASRFIAQNPNRKANTGIHSHKNRNLFYATMDNIVRILKKEVTFEITPNKESEQSLGLESQVKTKVLFKVKTTNPNRYYVKPNIGILGPRETTQLRLVLNALPSVPDDIASSKDKFLIQVAPYPDAGVSTTGTPGSPTAPASPKEGTGSVAPGTANVEDDPKALWNLVKPESILSQKIAAILILPNQPGATSPSGAQGAGATSPKAAQDSVSPRSADKKRVMSGDGTGSVLPLASQQASSFFADSKSSKAAAMRTSLGSSTYKIGPNVDEKLVGEFREVIRRLDEVDLETRRLFMEMEQLRTQASGSADGKDQSVSGSVSSISGSGVLAASQEFSTLQSGTGRASTKREDDDGSIDLVKIPLEQSILFIIVCFFAIALFIPPSEGW